MEKKMKAVWINEEIHKLLKEYCDANGQKMIFVVEKLIKDKLNEQRK